MHHGYYPSADFKDHKAAQLAMIDNSLAWAYGKDELKRALGNANSMVDVGCGVGVRQRICGTLCVFSLSPNHCIYV